MNAAWKPFSTATIMARSATSVLPDAHVALHEAVHGMRRLHVVGDLAQDPLLGAGQGEGQDLLDRLAGGGCDLEGHGLLPAAPAAASLREAELEQEELLQDEPAMATAPGRVERGDVFVVRRQVDPAEGFPEPAHPEPRAQLGREEVGQIVGDLRGEATDDAAEAPFPRGARSSRRSAPPAPRRRPRPRRPEPRTGATASAGCGRRSCRARPGRTRRPGPRGAGRPSGTTG